MINIDIRPSEYRPPQAKTEPLAQILKSARSPDPTTLKIYKRKKKLRRRWAKIKIDRLIISRPIKVSSIWKSSKKKNQTYKKAQNVLLRQLYRDARMLYLTNGRSAYHTLKQIPISEAYLLLTLYPAKSAKTEKAVNWLYQKRRDSIDKIHWRSATRRSLLELHSLNAIISKTKSKKSYRQSDFYNYTTMRTAAVLAPEPQELKPRNKKEGYVKVSRHAQWIKTQALRSVRHPTNFFHLDLKLRVQNQNWFIPIKHKTAVCVLNNRTDTKNDSFSKKLVRPRKRKVSGWFKLTDLEPKSNIWGRPPINLGDQIQTPQGSYNKTQRCGEALTKQFGQKNKTKSYSWTHRFSRRSYATQTLKNIKKFKSGNRPYNSILPRNALLYRAKEALGEHSPISLKVKRRPVKQEIRDFYMKTYWQTLWPIIRQHYNKQEIFEFKYSTRYSKLKSYFSGDLEIMVKYEHSWTASPPQTQWKLRNLQLTQLNQGSLRSTPLSIKKANRLKKSTRRVSIGAPLMILNFTKRRKIVYRKINTATRIRHAGTGTKRLLLAENKTTKKFNLRRPDSRRALKALNQNLYVAGHKMTYPAKLEGPYRPKKRNAVVKFIKKTKRPRKLPQKAQADANLSITWRPRKIPLWSREFLIRKWPRYIAQTYNYKSKEGTRRASLPTQNWPVRSETQENKDQKRQNPLQCDPNLYNNQSPESKPSTLDFEEKFGFIKTTTAPKNLLKLPNIHIKGVTNQVLKQHLHAEVAQTLPSIPTLKSIEWALAFRKKNRGFIDPKGSRFKTKPRIFPRRRPARLRFVGFRQKKKTTFVSKTYRPIKKKPERTISTVLMWNNNQRQNPRTARKLKKHFRSWIKVNPSAKIFKMWKSYKKKPSTTQAAQTYQQQKTLRAIVQTKTLISKKRHHALLAKITKKRQITSRRVTRHKTKEKLFFWKAKKILTQPTGATFKWEKTKQIRAKVRKKKLHAEQKRPRKGKLTRLAIFYTQLRPSTMTTVERDVPLKKAAKCKPEVTCVYKHIADFKSQMIIRTLNACKEIPGVTTLMRDLSGSYKKLGRKGLFLVKQHEMLNALALMLTLKETEQWGVFLAKTIKKLTFKQQRRFLRAVFLFFRHWNIFSWAYQHVMGFYFKMQGSIAVRGGMRKRNYIFSYGQVPSNTYMLSYYMHNRLLWNRAGAVGLKTILVSKK